MTSAEGSYFVDANVLVYAALADDPRHEASKAFLKGDSRGLLHLSPQILTEFYSIVTSSKRVTAPYSPAEAIEFIEALLGYEHVVVLPISPDVPARWMAFLKTVEVRGPHIFDLQIAATMLVNGVTSTMLEVTLRM
jgi:uncharacterized protein